MKKQSFFLALAIVSAMSIVSCSKKGNAPSESLLVKDLSVNESFGLKINFSAYGGIPKGGEAWGSASQFFISAETDILKADFSSNSLSSIAPNSGGLVTGLSGDQSKMLFAGKINNNYGYYSYSVAGSGPISLVLSLNTNEATNLLVYGNHLLLNTGTLVTTGRPCTSIWDFWCGTNQTVQNYTLYHIDGTTRASTVIGPSQSAVLFSGNGQKALITSSITSKYYIYDLNLLQKIDSFSNTGGPSFWGNNDLRALHIDFNGDVVITNPITNVEIDRFQTSTQLYTSPSGVVYGISWGATGRKIYYTGPCTSGGCSYAIWSFDLDTRQEKQHVFKTATAGPEPFGEIRVSPDDRNIVFRYINSLYLKTL
jgi:hypothetical protein